jgi:UDP-N-acetylglucosamine 2-epimerase (non-hydrolysing)
MKIMTILGTRPEIIRLSRVIARLDKHSDHILVDTGQNYDPRLSDIFYDELKVRKPNYNLKCKAATPMALVAQILERTEEVLLKEQPDRLLVLGDTNSALSVICAKRMGIPVYHMEAGNRCFDDRVPEEVNRRIIDHSSDVLLPYTERSRQNLLDEGVASRKIYVTGNPILEVIQHYTPQIETSKILSDLKLTAGKFFLVTLHRAENVDIPERLDSILQALANLHTEYTVPVVISLHPRTRSQLTKQPKQYEADGLRMIEPFGFFDFIKLEKSAFCTLSDSGTVQEECAIFGVPSVTLRDVTERPETLECGGNILCGANPKKIALAVELVTSDDEGVRRAPPEYMIENVSSVVSRIICGK